MPDTRIVELVIVMAAVMVSTLAPMFLMASSIDQDEFMKAGAGMAAGTGAVILTYRLWRGEKV